MIRVRETGRREAVAMLDRLADRLERPGPVMRELVDDVLDLQRQWWATDGRGTWAPSTDPGELMHESGDLEAAATRRGARGQDVVVGLDTLLFEVTLPHAEPLARGSGRRAPRGSVLNPTDRDADRLADSFLDHLLELA